VSSVAGHSDGARIRAILAGSAGSLIEWYDFYIYAFTALYFSAEFFPKSDPLVQLMATSGIFAAGFLMRPIGGWYFGRYADRRGRKGAMVVSVALMGVGSLVIGIMPTYAQVGIAAPALLLVGRMIQGFSTGGQYGTVATYLSEVAGKSRRGFWSSFQYVTLIGGQLLASLLVLVLQLTLSDEAMRSYGWRIGFILGAIGASTILLFREHMVETAPSEGSHRDAGSLAELFGNHWPAVLTVVMLTAGGSLAFYTFTTYMQKYLVLTVGLSKQTATIMMTAALTIFMLLQPVLGLLSDQIGRRNNILIFGALATCLTVPILTTLGNGPATPLAFLLVLAGLTINGFYTSVSGIFKAELFPMHVRALGVGLAYGLSNAIFGGTAESVALAFKSSGREQYFYWYVSAMCLLSLAAGITLKDSRKGNRLDDVAPVR
jgi:MHS family alpha-ketoglutarate permease-like MFS transporter